MEGSKFTQFQQVTFTNNNGGDAIGSVALFGNVSMHLIATSQFDDSNIYLDGETSVVKNANSVGLTIVCPQTKVVLVEGYEGQDRFVCDDPPTTVLTTTEAPTTTIEPTSLSTTQSPTTTQNPTTSTKAPTTLVPDTDKPTQSPATQSPATQSPDTKPPVTATPSNSDSVSSDSSSSSTDILASKGASDAIIGATGPSSSGLSAGAIAGIVIGAIIFLLLVILVVFIVYQKVLKKEKEKKDEEIVEMGATTA
eukprot:TRINITY_DN5711_c0_g1_i1.p1 TRINITY_DN5711_c0_g1~~TRINITY_DN5711_c0_g1_i1.p1  ORF type:complete len:252 (-),score=73.71 TRINITY_DN5711_c0_g1_i1:53-808(-)